MIFPGCQPVALWQVTSTGFRDDAIYFDHSGDCRDARYHTGCPGRWRGAVSLGVDAAVPP
jgi:hypothetical protein